MTEAIEPNVPVPANRVAVALEPIESALVDTGAPAAGATALAELDTVEVGVWEMSEGTARDIEVDEVFIVISGRATVVVADGPTFEVESGDIVQLRAGDRTTWTVHERLRKVYVALG